MWRTEDSQSTDHPLTSSTSSTKSSPENCPTHLRRRSLSSSSGAGSLLSMSTPNVGCLVQFLPDGVGSQETVIGLLHREHSQRIDTLAGYHCNLPWVYAHVKKLGCGTSRFPARKLIQERLPVEIWAPHRRPGSRCFGSPPENARDQGLCLPSPKLLDLNCKRLDVGHLAFRNSTTRSSSSGISSAMNSRRMRCAERFVTTVSQKPSASTSPCVQQSP